MTWLTDNPVPLLMLGFLVQVVLGLILWQSGQKWILAVMGLLAVVSVGLLVVESVIVSPTEEVTARLHEIAAIVSTNQEDAILACLVADNAELRSNVSGQLRRIEIQEARVTSAPEIDFETDPATQHPLATVRFFGRIKGKLLRDPSPYDQIVGRYTVYLRKEPDNRWLVTGYEIDR